MQKIRICVICLKEFRYEYKKTGKKTCSNICSNKLRKLSTRKAHTNFLKKNPNYWKKFINRKNIC
jgi:hypothetical protein